MNEEWCGEIGNERSLNGHGTSTQSAKSMVHQPGFICAQFRISLCLTKGSYLVNMAKTH